MEGLDEHVSEEAPEVPNELESHLLVLHEIAEERDDLPARAQIKVALADCKSATGIAYAHETIAGVKKTWIEEHVRTARLARLLNEEEAA